MPISLQKGQKVSLTKGNPGLTKVVVGLGWDVNSFDTGGDFDLDAAAFLLGESGKVTSIFRPMALLGNALFIVDVPENLQEREGMTFTTVSVDEQELPGWTFDDPQFSDYALIYAMNEKGELNYYQYEKTQNTLQLYSGAAAISEQAYAREQQREQIFIIAAGVFAASTIIALIACILIRMRCNRRIAHVIRSSQKGDEA